MLQYLYKLTYLQDHEVQIPIKHTDPVLHANMFVVGIDLGIFSLRQTAIRKLKDWLESYTFLTTAPVTPLFWTRSSLPESEVLPLESAVSPSRHLPAEALRAFSEVLKVIWSTEGHETSEVKELLFEYVQANMEELSTRGSFQDLLNSGLGFAHEWLQYDQRIG